MTPRMEPASPPFDDTSTRLLARITPPGKEPLRLFRTMVRSPRILERMFAGALLDPGPLGLRERELMILRTCARCGAEYEWGVHVAYFSARAGIDAEQVAATCGPLPAPCWSERDALVLQLADALHDAAQVSEPLWQALAQEFTHEQLLELLALAGYYHAISFLVNGCRVEHETGTPRFPGNAQK
ncbi:MAG TPA: carboxymuconolactone decarboxylase family protein [Noviherbaspirillum sp.]|jgi:hypothetical protein|uniref:carboxymuconolactone decarboxylase family protein n=1 Tax=Noviherbaspirillum sp. TaxID=1926288 RepID=UPI002F931383